MKNVKYTHPIVKAESKNIKENDNNLYDVRCFNKNATSPRAKLRRSPRANSSRATRKNDNEPLVEELLVISSFFFVSFWNAYLSDAPNQRVATKTSILTDAIIVGGNFDPIQ